MTEYKGEMKVCPGCGNMAIILEGNTFCLGEACKLRERELRDLESQVNLLRRELDEDS